MLSVAFLFLIFASISSGQTDQTSAVASTTTSTVAPSTITSTVAPSTTTSTVAPSTTIGSSYSVSSSTETPSTTTSTEPPSSTIGSSYSVSSSTTTSTVASSTVASSTVASSTVASSTVASSTVTHTTDTSAASTVASSTTTSAVPPSIPTSSSSEASSTVTPSTTTSTEAPSTTTSTEAPSTTTSTEAPSTTTSAVAETSTVPPSTPTASSSEASSTVTTSTGNAVFTSGVVNVNSSTSSTNTPSTSTAESTNNPSTSSAESTSSSSSTGNAVFTSGVVNVNSSTSTTSTPSTYTAESTYTASTSSAESTSSNSSTPTAVFTSGVVSTNSSTSSTSTPSTYTAESTSSNSSTSTAVFTSGAENTNSSTYSTDIPSTSSTENTNSSTYTYTFSTSSTENTNSSTYSTDISSTSSTENTNSSTSAPPTSSATSTNGSTNAPFTSGAVNPNGTSSTTASSSSVSSQQVTATQAFTYFNATGAAYENYTTVAFSFGQPTDQGGYAQLEIFPCSQFVTGFPQNYSCIFADSETLVANIEPAADLRTTPLTVSGNIQSQQSRLSPTQFSGVTVPDYLLDPTVNIIVDTPPAQSRNSTFVVSASFGAPVTAFFVPATTKFTSVVNYDNGLYVFVNGRDLTVGQNILVAQSTNVFGVFASATYNFTVAYTGSLSVVGGPALSVYPNASVVFSAVSSPPLPAAASYTWNVYQFGGLTNNSLFSGSGVNFTLPAYSLNARSVYTVVPTAAVNGQIVVGSATTVTVLASPPKVIITPGTVVAIGTQQPLTIDASQSVNLNSLTIPLTGVWTLVSSPTGFTGVIPPVSSLTLSFPARTFTAGNYVFGLTFSGFTTVYYVNVTVYTANIPVVTIQTLTTYNPSNYARLVATASVPNDTIASYAWSVTGGNVNITSIGYTNQSLYIPAGFLSTCTAYLFKLTALTTTSRVSGFATTTVQTVCPPTPPASNLVTLNPPTGTQLSTNFSVSTSGWTSFGNQLTYTYTYYTTSDAAGASSQTLLGTSTGQVYGSFAASVSQATNFTVVVTAVDQFGASTTTSTTVTVAAYVITAANSQAALNLVTQNLNSTNTAASVAAVGAAINVLTQIANTNGTSKADVINYLSQIANTFVALTNSNVSVSSADARNTINALTAAVNLSVSVDGNSTSAATSNAISTLANGIANTLRNLQLEGTATLDPAVFDSVLQVIRAALATLRASNKRATYNPASVYNLLNQAVATNLRNRVCDGDTNGATVIGDLTVLTRSASGLTLNGKTFDLNGATVSFASNAVSTSTCYPVSMVRLPFDPVNQNAAPVDITQGNSSVVSVSGVTSLTGTIAINYPLSGEDVQNAQYFTCAYRQNYTQPWTIDSTVTANVQGSTITCTTTHLTEFAVQNPGPSASTTSQTDTSPVATPSSSSGLSGGQIAGIVIGSVVGGILIIGLIVFVVIKLRNKRRDGPLTQSIPMHNF